MAWANVATNRPIDSWLGRSRKNVCTILGENCPIANCTTTIVIVSTNVANDTIDTAIVVRMANAASGPPVIHDGITSKPKTRSIATVPSDNTMPPSTHITGMNHRAERIPVDGEAIDAPYRSSAVTSNRRRSRTAGPFTTVPSWPRLAAAR